jgi:hypothetical protein
MSKYICNDCNKEFKFASLLSAHQNRKSPCTDPKPEPKPKIKPEPKPELKQKVTTETKSELKQKVTTEPKAKPEPKAEPKAKPELKQKVTTEPKAKPEPKPKVKAIPEVKKAEQKPKDTNVVNTFNHQQFAEQMQNISKTCANADGVNNTIDAEQLNAQIQAALQSEALQLDPNNRVQETVINRSYETVIDIYVSPLTFSHTYYMDLHDFDPLDNKYIVKKDDDLLADKDRKDIIFARALSFKNTLEDLTKFLGDFIIKHCLEDPNKTEESGTSSYMAAFMDPYSELDALLNATRLLVTLLNYYEAHDESIKITDVVITPFIELVRQFIYSYVLKYMTPMRVDIHSIVKFYDSLGLINDPALATGLLKMIQPHLTKEGKEIKKEETEKIENKEEI